MSVLHPIRGAVMVTERINDARVIKWLWSNVIKNRFKGGVRSFED